MNRFATFYELTIFEAASQAPQASGKTRRWTNGQQSKHVSYAFVQGTLFILDVVILVMAGLIGFTTHASIMTIMSMELLYLEAGLLLLLARTCTQFFSVVGIYLVVCGIAIILNLGFPGLWGRIYLYLLCTLMSYRFPARWAFPFAMLCLFTLITPHGLLLSFPHAVDGWTLGRTLAIACGLYWVGWGGRVQLLLVTTFQETQDRWKEQIRERERTRIARDIHDVLSHSLSVLSIQVQAAQHLRTRDPERQAETLDEMAALIHESITESRRVIGQLRDKPPIWIEQDDLSARLRLIATTFQKRTGIQCLIDEREESETPKKIRPQQKETLELALREMLANAHRHGGAQTIWITIHWQRTTLLLEAHDDGAGAKATLHCSMTRDERCNQAGGHYGLQGMRERAAALGGSITAGPAESGGFQVSLKLPFERLGLKEDWRECSM